MVWSGAAGGIDRTVPIRLRILQPLYLVHGIFAGYGFVTAIFYWLDLNGIRPVGIGGGSVPGEIAGAAEAQRYYVLAHAALASGLIMGGQTRRIRQFRFSWDGSTAGLLLLVSGVASLGSIVMGYVPGMGQLETVLSRLGFVAGASSFGPSLAGSGRAWFPVSLVLNLIFLALAIASGWKEEVIVWLVLVGLGTFPFFPKLTLILGPSLFLGSLVFLPLMSNVVRQLSWGGDVSKTAAVGAGIRVISGSSSEEIIEATWDFATGRLSESSMFVRYIDSVNQGTPREGLSILRQSLLAPVPRILWPAKPILETMVMQRVYDHGVVSDLSAVSAKPHPVVDAYLVGGALGIIGCFLCLGLLGSWAFAFCRDHFGGMFLGGVFFNGLFSMLWRGNAFEFMAATLFWSVAVAFGIHCLLQASGFSRSVTSKTRPRLSRTGSITSPDQ